MEVFKRFVEKMVLGSAQKAVNAGMDLSDKSWLAIENGKAVSMDFSGYVKDITRMKTAPAFDDLSLCSPRERFCLEMGK